MTEQRIFIGFCWGAAATTWLARLLNSHEDIFCIHSPMFPRFDHFQLAESTLLLDEFFRSKSFGGDYPVVGLTHGVASEWYEALADHYSAQLRCFAVTRHPVSRIQSAFDLWLHEADFRQAHPTWKQAYAEAYETLGALSLRTFPDDYASVAFYKACTLVNSITWERRQPFPLFRQEDLVSDEPTVQRLVTHISDGTCRLPEAVVRKLQDIVIFRHARRQLSIPDTYAAWRPEHREAYHLLVTAAAFDAYRELGYELPHAV